MENRMLRKVVETNILADLAKKQILENQDVAPRKAGGFIQPLRYRLGKAFRLLSL